LLRKSLSPDPRPGGSREAPEDRRLRVLYLPEARDHAGCSFARPQSQRGASLYLEDEDAAPSPGAEELGDHRARHEIRARPTQLPGCGDRQDGAGSWRLGLLECVPWTLGDDRRGVVWQLVVSRRGLVRGG